MIVAGAEMPMPYKAARGCRTKIWRKLVSALSIFETFPVFVLLNR